MNEDGRKFDVIVERETLVDPRTGVEMPTRSVEVWADESMEDVISSVAGVTNVFQIACKTNYKVYVDKRYDVDFVAKEIERAIIRHMEQK